MGHQDYLGEIYVSYIKNNNTIIYQYSGDPQISARKGNLEPDDRMRTLLWVVLLLSVWPKL